MWGWSREAAKWKQRCDSFRTRCPHSFIAVCSLLLGQWGYFLLICPCIRSDLDSLPVHLRLFHLASPSTTPRKPTAAGRVERGVCKHMFVESTGKPATESSPPAALCFSSSSSQAIPSGFHQFLMTLGTRSPNTERVCEGEQDGDRRE